MLEAIDLAGAADPLWETALPVLQELRPHITVELLSQILRDGSGQGPQFTALLLQEECVAIAGWRIMVNTSSLRKLYVDDLVTAEKLRGKGYGSILFRHLRGVAISFECALVELHSGPERHGAHRFYLNEGMSLAPHLFRMELPQ